MKAVVVVLSDEVADDVSRLFHGCLTMNGYSVEGPPSVIDWPLAAACVPVIGGENDE